MKEDDHRITLRQMQIFLTAVECRSFIRAAENLALSPPAVSMQMSRLSEHFGATLFIKDGRGVRPTEIATALVPYAERLTETLKEAEYIVKVLQGKLDNLIRISMVSTARNFGPQLIARFSALFPDAHIEMDISNREGVIARLQKGQSDIALMGRPPKRIKVEAHQFAKHPYVLICHPDHPLVSASRIKKAHLQKCRFLVREPGSGTRLVHEHFFRDAQLPLPEAQEMDSNANIKQAVMANMALAFISAHTVALERSAGKLCVLDVNGMPQFRDWFVVYPSEIPLRSAVKNFADFISSEGEVFMKDFFGDDYGERQNSIIKCRV